MTDKNVYSPGNSESTGEGGGGRPPGDDAGLESESDLGDFVVAARCATATEAHVLKETLIAAGVIATLADAHIAQTHPWMANAGGGVRVLVPAAMAAQARQTVAEFHAGTFELEDQAGADGQGRSSAAQEQGPGFETYRIFTSTQRKPAVVAVKVGFSWSALCVGPLWFLLNGMWQTFLLSFSFFWGAPWIIRSLAEEGYLGDALSRFLVTGAFLGVWVLTGLVANFLFGEELKSKGYTLKTNVRARSVGEAIDAGMRAA